MAFFTFFFHILLDYCLGAGVLSFFKKEIPFGFLFIAFLLGMFLETTICFIGIWLGLDLKFILAVTSILALFLQSKNILYFSQNPTKILKSLTGYIAVMQNNKWYDYLLILLITQKVTFILWQLFRMPTFHSDAIKHWSTQARALYSQVNFSMSPNTYEFLGRKLKVVLEYPLQLPIWRANSAILNGGWDEFVSRSDGLFFFIITCGLVGSVLWMLTKKSWVALGTTYIIASLPLQVWHGAAGYADIAVEAYLVAAIACFIGKEWLLCGIFMAGAVWSKNDGLALYLPGVLVAGFVYHVFQKKVPFVNRIKKMGQFVLGFSFIFPWLIFQAIHSNSVFSKIITPIKGIFSYQYYDPNDFTILLTQVGRKFQNSPPSYQLFWEHVFIGSTFGIFWIVIFLSFIFCIKQLFSDQIGRSLGLFFITTCIVIYYIFTYTPAYEFLLIQTTIHRTMLQFAATSLIIIGYGFSLHMKKISS